MLKNIRSPQQQLLLSYYSLLVLLVFVLRNREKPIRRLSSRPMRGLLLIIMPFGFGAYDFKPNSTLQELGLGRFLTYVLTVIPLQGRHMLYAVEQIAAHHHHHINYGIIDDDDDVEFLLLYYNILASAST